MYNVWIKCNNHINIFCSSFKSHKMNPLKMSYTYINILYNGIPNIGNSVIYTVYNQQKEIKIK